MAMALFKVEILRMLRPSMRFLKAVIILATSGSSLEAAKTNAGSEEAGNYHAHIAFQTQLPKRNKRELYPQSMMEGTKFCLNIWLRVCF